MTLRWPVEPLLARAGCGHTRAFSERYGVSHATLRDPRGLTDRVADRYAVAAGFHPAEVWGYAWFEAVLGSVDVLFVNLAVEMWHLAREAA